jgi:serine/threonine protein kinase
MRPVVHRDIKPANVVVEADGRAVLTDLGLGLRSALERCGSNFSGTPMFMAPELLEGGAATVRSDLYALGVLLRWAVTGRAPFAAVTLAELRAEAPAGPARPLLADRGDVPVGLA